MKWIIAALVVVTCLVLATWAVAGDPPAKLIQVAENHENFAERTSMLAEIRAVMDSMRCSKQVLIEELGTDNSPELTRRMGELKKSSRMRILQIQLNYARGEGRAELESRILTCIEDLQRPVAQTAVKSTGGFRP
ncbi:MAG: hypothetical protein KAH56_06460 [Candidatus Krumholzibacteria bacterium]|nr:hypothetical protein [Candidatus Krumholzibacteria bacterium]